MPRKNGLRYRVERTVGEAESMLLEPARHDKVLGRFMDRVVAEPGGCWRWVGTFRDRRGRVRSGQARPIMQVAGKRVYVARAAWMLRNGVPFPAGKICSHECDRHDCVNPGHIRPATVAENNREACERGLRPLPYGGEETVVALLEFKRAAFLNGERVNVVEAARKTRVPVTYAERVLRMQSLRVKAIAERVGV